MLCLSQADRSEGVLLGIDFSPFVSVFVKTCGEIYLKSGLTVSDKIP